MQKNWLPSFAKMTLSVILFTSITTTHASQAVQSFQQAATLSPSIASLALAMNCKNTSTCGYGASAVLTGKKRIVNIKNTATTPATTVTVTTEKFPQGTIISNNTCIGKLNPGSSCQIEITPGDQASSDANNKACTVGSSPLPGILNITADGGDLSQVPVYVLGYGCQYEGGLVYSVDDTTPDTMSIQGKVVSLTDSAEPFINSARSFNGVVWGSNGNSATTSDVDYTVILGIGEHSNQLIPAPILPVYPAGTPRYEFCLGNSDGACNSKNIVSYYNFNRQKGGAAPTPVTHYAAGLCTQANNGYSDWSLPAICEMNANGGFLLCPSNTQSMLNNLVFLLGDPHASSPSHSCSAAAGIDCLAGYYWSSTETAMTAKSYAWSEYFTSGIHANQAINDKNAQLGVRCTRHF